MHKGNEIEVVAFDLGGVLVELGGIDRWLAWAGPGLTEEDMWREWLASPTVREFETDRIPPETFARRMVREFALPLSEDRFLREFTAWVKDPYPGAEALVRAVPRRYRRICLSNTNRIHWARMDREMGFAESFDEVFPSHLTGRLKPDVETYRWVADRLGCVPSRILLLEDNALNVAGARAAGWRAERVEGIAETRRRLTELGVLPPAAGPAP